MPKQQIIDYIQQERDRGVADDDIRSALHEKGWGDTEINQAMAVAATGSSSGASGAYQSPQQRQSEKEEAAEGRAEAPGFWHIFWGVISSPRGTFQRMRGTDLGAIIGYYMKNALLGYIIFLISFIVIAIALMSMAGAILGDMGSMSGGSAPSPGFGDMLKVLGVIYLVMIMISAAVSYFLVWPVMLAIYAGIVHLILMALGTDSDYVSTFRAIIYGATPTTTLNLVPLLSIIMSVWSLILMVVGVSVNHNISTAKASAAVLIPGVIALGILFVLFMSALIPDVEQYTMLLEPIVS